MLSFSNTTLPERERFHAYGSQMLTLDVFLNHFPFCLLRLGLPLNLANSATLVGQQFSEIPLSRPSQLLDDRNAPLCPATCYWPSHLPSPMLSVLTGRRSDSVSPFLDATSTRSPHSWEWIASPALLIIHLRRPHGLMVNFVDFTKPQCAEGIPKNVYIGLV